MMEVVKEVVIFSFLVGVFCVSAFDIRNCNSPLGMESGAISDDSITASSSYVPNVGPTNGRLRIEKAGGGWCPKEQVDKGTREYLQVDLGTIHVVTGVQTQGRYDRGRGQEYVEEYTVEYWRPGLQNWKEYKRWDNKQVLRGNGDTATVETNRLMPPIFANKIRIIPYSVHRRTVCLRLELLGCSYGEGIVSYYAPEGSDGSQGLLDSSYDGHVADGTLEDGIGRLVDGEIGGDNFRLDIGYGKGNGWVGWRNGSQFPNGYVELLFKFDQIRNFSSVSLFTNNFFTKNVQVFAKAKVMFSVGGEFYNGQVISYSYIADKMLENARNVTINLHNRIARFIKMHLYFADEWIMLSEVAFDSIPVDFNVTEEVAFDSDENELIITSYGDNSMDNFETITTINKSEGYIEVIIGIVTAIMLLLLVVFFIVLIFSRRHKLQGSPALLRNSFGMNINVKDFLLNFSTSRNNPTPNGYPPVNRNLRLDKFDPSLKNSQSCDIRSNSSQSEGEDPPEVPPLPASPTLYQTSEVNSTASLHYNSLLIQPSVNTASGLINLESYFPKAEPTNNKLYDTIEDLRVHPNVSWNIAPSMDHPYTCREVDLTSIPHNSLIPIEEIGSCHLGEVNLYELQESPDIITSGQLVVVRKTNNDEAVIKTPAESLREIRFLAGLQDPNVCRIVGVCTAEYPLWTIIEYGDVGDLTQYLQFMANRTIVKCSEPPVSTDCLLFMAMQIASGMKYLESKNVLHKDLAARNCLVGHGYVIKITDIAISKPQYRKDYAELDGRAPVPIRWLPWESIILDRYTCSSSVWSFAVTLWEIYTYALEKPYHKLSNEKILHNAERMYYGEELPMLLSMPPSCPADIYELMCQCWRRDDASRPTFKQIYPFLKQINNNFSPTG